MKVANISIDMETYEVTIEFSKAFEKEDWLVKADALRIAMEELFEVYDSVLRREIEV